MALKAAVVLAVMLAWCCVTVASDETAKPGLRDESDVEKLREEAISKLDKPLEKMRIKELKQLLQERGVTCKACSEKAQLVQTVRENIHLPAKKEHLNKFANMPSQVEDEEVKTILEQIKKKQAEEQKLKDMLKAQGINTEGMQFSGGMGGMDPETMAKILKDQPSK